MSFNIEKIEIIETTLRKKLNAQRSLFLAIFLLANMFFILLFKFISKKETEALLYYICDFVIRVTFSIPVSFIIFYFLLYRFLGIYLGNAILQVVVFLILFVVFDYLMKVQIKYQIGVNFFKIHDKV